MAHLALNATMADVFLALIQMATAIKALPTERFILETYQLIQRKALALWSKVGGGSKLAFTLAVQMNTNYDDFKSPCSYSYINELQTHQSWIASSHLVSQIFINFGAKKNCIL
ncbi:hypothetical protein C1646_762268 [Rhizophagus diaphanus]|nr:hypothetical protein C1646_762268 [Rhizophagus diaphanus] [Rhizophagus sp. MUCL 43196]